VLISANLCDFIARMLLFKQFISYDFGEIAKAELEKAVSLHLV
jgi:hypothetical protein